MANADQPPNKTLRVLVIGAGTSGLAAAQTLLSHDCQVKVLEAKDRIGGRVQTISIGDHLVDMGASWIHGIGPGAGGIERWVGKPNPIYELVKSNNIKTVVAWKNESTAKINFYDYKSPGISVDNSTILDLIQRMDHHIGAKIDTTSTNDSLKHVLADFDPKVESHLFNAVLSHTYCQYDAAESSELSLKCYDEIRKFDGEEHVFLEGFETVIKVLSKVVDIELEKVVKEINYTNEQVKVKTSDGSEYLADKVIVTVPLGVLQSNLIKFTPNLSEAKAGAIKRFGMGLMDKLWLEFPEAFWKNDNDTDWICFAGETTGLWVDAINFYKYTGRPLLVMLNVANVAVNVGKMSDQEVLEGAMKVIRNMYPDAPDYVNYARSNWGSDPFALGSYPFVKIGAEDRDFEMYIEAESTRERVFFAGDGTIRGMIGCVHAAYISGVDAANSAVESFRKREREKAERTLKGPYLLVIPAVLAFIHAKLFF